MEDIHREAIRKNFSSLVYQTDFKTMRDALTEKGLFTEYMIAHFEDESLLTIDKKRSMYNAIMRRGPQAFDILLETLQEKGYWELVRMLDPNSSLNAVSNGPSTSTHSNMNENKNYVSLINTRNMQPKEQNSNIVPIEKYEPVPPATPHDHEAPQFEVIKSTKFIEDNEINDIKLYRTRSRHRGVCLLLTYINFQFDVDKERRGAERDRNNLKYLFSEIGLKVVTYEDLTYDETVNMLDELKVVLGPEQECIFVVVSSHGYERRGTFDTDILCHDGRLISLQEIIAYFSNKRLPHLRNVPKVFVFQNCRGRDEHFIDTDQAPPPLMLPVGTDGTPIPSSPSATQASKNTALYTNILVVQSTLPGFVSYRDPTKGSWYIQVLCEKFAERAHDTHVDDLFTMVDQLLKKRSNNKQTSSVDRWGFNRRLYLHPGLFE